MPLNATSIADFARNDYVHDNTISLDNYRFIGFQKEPLKMSDFQFKSVESLKTQLRGIEPKAQAILYAITESGSLTNKEIREGTGLSLPVVSRLADVCIEEGLASKKKKGGHRRAAWLYQPSQILASNRGIVLDILEECGAVEQIENIRQKEEGRGSDSQKAYAEADVPSVLAPYIKAQRSPARKALLETLVHVANVAKTSAGDLSRVKGWSTTASEERLKSLVEVGLAKRNREGVYIYSLTTQGIKLCQAAGIHTRASEQPSILEKGSSLGKETAIESQLINKSSSTEAMSNNTLSELASAVKLLANEVVKLNKRVESIEKGQRAESPDFKLEDIERLFQGGSEHE